MKKVTLPQSSFVASNFRFLIFSFISLITTVSFSSTGYANNLANGEQTTLVLIVNFQENPQEIPISNDEAHSLVFETVNEFYSQVSQGRLWLTGEVAGTFTLPISNQICNDDAVAAEANKMAQNAGFNLSNYDRFIYLTTKTSCSSEGSGSQGVTPSRANINGVFEPRVIAHELGHNFGLHHSSALDCQDGAMTGSCRVIEYGDSYDTMGNYDMGYFNAFQLESLGWLGSQAQVISVDGVYAISPYESVDSSQASVLKVPRGVDPVTGKPQWFYIEYRQPIGFDNFLNDRSYKLYRQDVTEGIVVRLATDGAPKSSRLLHMKPDSMFKQLFGNNDWEDPALPIGGTFVDPTSGVSITLESANGSSAQVSVLFDGNNKQCVATAPQISITAVKDIVAQAGETLEFQLRITNQNSDNCEDATYLPSLDVPSGWVYNTKSISVASGTTKVTNITVTSSPSAHDETYNIPVQVSESKYNQIANSSLSYSVESTSSAKVQAIDDNIIINDKAVTRIYQLNNDIFDNNANLNITISSPNKGTARLLSDGSIEYVPENKFKNSDSFSYTINDGNSTSTAIISISLQSSSGGNGGNGGKGKPK
ncbi:Ig-like domain-containing protein [Vibrio rotiferianus]|uniref:Ig-like domain-containing protein n=1 Tax=Vibrio rotiferianus TaxID=190895 RepID=UPI00406AA265